ncbi:MAG TPA: hypothetical protein VFX39_08720 [Gemmatimonadaceae bacterium]|nr:hypothetical protein [Gemmatimonadaceae bacterium]
MERAPVIRPLASEADYAACLALQHETWGPDFGEAVPPAILKVAQRLGGVAAGAFDESGRLLGFVFGMTGVEHGRVVHWSDMLAVRPELRDAGLGRRLKAWQRDAARAAGAVVMYWTYDPLVARNAHLNFNRLGVRAHEYVRDMYGEPTSGLHRGLGTDRLVVAWPLDADPSPSACPNGEASELPPALADAPRITIPLDIHAVLARDPDAAAAWRARTRHEWESLLGDGFRVVCFWRDPAAGTGHYVLARG